MGCSGGELKDAAGLSTEAFAEVLGDIGGHHRALCGAGAGRTPLTAHPDLGSSLQGRKRSGSRAQHV